MLTTKFINKVIDRCPAVVPGKRYVYKAKEKEEYFVLFISYDCGDTFVPAARIYKDGRKTKFDFDRITGGNQFGPYGLKSLER